MPGGDGNVGTLDVDDAVLHAATGAICFVLNLHSLVDRLTAGLDGLLCFFQSRQHSMLSACLVWLCLNCLATLPPNGGVLVLQVVKWANGLPPVMRRDSSHATYWDW